ncbi:hypothetical protein RJI07_07755 [Mycoplasmatota bacterium WC30]
MELTELGFDYSNLVSCTVKKKNNLVALILLIVGVSLLPMSIIFLILFLSQAPMEINGVMTNYGDPGYNTFFYSFLGAFFSVALICIVLGFVFMLGKPKPYIILSKDIDYNPFYYIYNSRRHEEIYLNDKFAIVYNLKYNRAYHEVNPEAVKRIFKKFVFWANFANLTDYRIKHKPKKTVLKFKERSSGKFGSVLSKSYSFSNEITIVPYEVTELISSNYGGTNTQSMNKFFFENINQSQMFEIHPEIRRLLSTLN